MSVGQLEHQDRGASFPEPVDPTRQHGYPPVEHSEHFAWRNYVGIILWHGVPLSLPVGVFMSVRGLTRSLLEPLMLAEKLEPRVLDFWVLVRSLWTLPAEVSGPSSVTGSGLWQPSSKNFYGLTRMGTLCQRGWGNRPGHKSWL